MSAPPYMPLYVADYLADTTHLSTLEHGAYCLLLMSMWRAGGSLPNDPAKLAKFARMTSAQWARVEATVMQFFDVSDSDVTQSRLAREIEKHAGVVRQRRESGSRGGRAKALKGNDPALANARVLPCQPEPEPEPEESLGSKEDPKRDLFEDDPAKTAWSMAINLLTSRASMTEAKARAAFGRMIGANKITAPDMLPALGLALANGTRDPVSYLMKAAASVGKRKNPDPTDPASLEPDQKMTPSGLVYRPDAFC